ncbi:starch-binding protein [Clostridium butyricum]|uniref:starch-binding protein n=1 Tax=Clostridium butyricum TaxID=1492 RepID=UPI003464F5A1
MNGETLQTSGTDTDKPDEGNDDDVSDKLTKAYFENKDGWENLRVYFYTEKSDGSMNKEFSKWPGVELTSEGNDLYSYTFPKGYKNSTLIFNGTVTTSAAVSVDGTETTEKSVQTENLKIKAGELMIYSNGAWDKYTGENPDKDDDTSKVKKVSINGNFKVGNTLKTQIFNADGKEITPEVSYQWYRASSQSGEFEKIDGAINSQYKLTSSDKSKYIKVLVTDKDGSEVYSQVTSRISSSSSSHHSHNSSSSVSNDTSSNNDSVTENKVTNNNVPEKTESKLDKEGWNLNSDGTWIFVEKGNKVTGWKQVNNLWYFMNDNGVMNTGWKQINNTWYYMNNSGSMMTGWQFINNKWYYLNESGDMATGWKDVNGIWYYLYSDGSMAYNTIIDGYNLDVSGAWI